MEIFWKNEISINKVLIKIFFLDIIILFILIFVNCYYWKFVKVLFSGSICMCIRWKIVLYLVKGCVWLVFKKIEI